MAGGDMTRAANIHVLSPADHDIFTRAFAAAAEGDWANALALGNQGQDSVARQLLQWRYAMDRNSGAKFADIDAVHRHGGELAAAEPRSMPAPKPPLPPT